jgi:hypothetical protein
MVTEKMRNIFMILLSIASIYQGDCGYSVVRCVVRCVGGTFVTTVEKLLEVEVDGSDECVLHSVFFG